MKTQQLIDNLVETAKKGIKYNIENPNCVTGKYEELIPAMIILTKDDTYEVCILSAKKEEMPNLMKTILTQRQAKAYVLILEVWATPFYEEASRYNWRIRDMPEDDKSEIAQAMLVTKDGGCTNYSMAVIEHSENGRILREWKDEVPDTIKGSFLVTDW